MSKRKAWEEQWHRAKRQRDLIELRGCSSQTLGLLVDDTPALLLRYGLLPGARPPVAAALHNGLLGMEWATLLLPAWERYKEQQQQLRLAVATGTLLPLEPIHERHLQRRKELRYAIAQQTEVARREGVETALATEAFVSLYGPVRAALQMNDVRVDRYGMRVEDVDVRFAHGVLWAFRGSSNAGLYMHWCAPQMEDVELDKSEIRSRWRMVPAMYMVVVSGRYRCIKMPELTMSQQQRVTAHMRFVRRQRLPEELVLHVLEFVASVPPTFAL